MTNKANQIIDYLYEMCENETPVNYSSLLNTIGAVPQTFEEEGDVHLYFYLELEKDYVMVLRLLKDGKLGLFFGEEASDTKEGQVVIQRIGRLGARESNTKINREIELLTHINSLLFCGEYEADVADFYFEYTSELECKINDYYDNNGCFYARYYQPETNELVAEIKVRGEYAYHEEVDSNDNIQHIREITFRGEKLYKRENRED